MVYEHFDFGLGAPCFWLTRTWLLVYEQLVLDLRVPLFGLTSMLVLTNEDLVLDLRAPCFEYPNTCVFMSIFLLLVLEDHVVGLRAACFWFRSPFFCIYEHLCFSFTSTLYFYNHLILDLRALGFDKRGPCFEFTSTLFFIIRTPVFIL